MKIKKYREYLYGIFSTLAFAFLTSYYTLNSSPQYLTLPKHDSSMFQYFGMAMDQGRVIYRDIFDHKGPFLFFINYIAEIIGNNGLFIVEFLFLFLFLFFVYKTSLLKLNVFLSILLSGAISLFLPVLLEGGNLSEEYALLPISIALYLFSKYYIHGLKYWEITIIGITFALTLFLRVNMISVWAGFIPMILIEYLIKKDFKRIYIDGSFFVLGALIIIVSTIIYLVINNALGDAIYQNITYNFTYTDSFSLPFRELFSELFLNPVLVSFFVIYSIYIYESEVSFFDFGLHLSTIISLLSVIISRREYLHYLTVLIPLGAIYLIEIFYRSSILEDKKINNVIKSVLATGVLLSPIALYNYNYVYHTSNLTDPINQNKVETVKKIIENTDKDDLIYSHRLSGLFYIESNRLANTKYFNLPAGNIDENNKIKEEFWYDMRNKKPRLIVTRSDFEVQKAGEFHNQFREFVLGEYRLLYHNNAYRIYIED